MNDYFPRIPNEEFTQRINLLREKMKEAGIDAAVGFSNLLDPSIVRYFTDFSAVNESSAIVIPAAGQIDLCSGQASLDYAQIKNRLENSNIIAFPEVGEVSGFEYDFEGQMNFRSYFSQFKKSHDVKKIALMGKLIFPAVIYNSLRETFPDAEFVDFDAELYDLRLNKSANEIAVIEKCSEIISETFKKVIPAIKENMTELEIQAMFESEMLRLGGESYVQAFAPMIATGKENSYISMCRNTLRKVKPGEILNIAAGVCYEGYNAIICTPHVIGKAPEEIKRAVKCACEALDLASESMVPGASAADVLNVYTEYLEKAGYIEFCPYGSLHSIGLLECEAPLYTVENGRIIKENTTMCIDAYFKGMEWGSFRIEDCYLITKNGAKRMTSYNDAALPLLLS